SPSSGGNTSVVSARKSSEASGSHPTSSDPYMTSRTPFLRTSLITFCIAVAALSAPQQAAACIYRVDHNFSPFPPCTFEDMPAHERVNQLNSRLTAKLTLIIGKIRMVKREIAAWKGAYESVRQWDDR